MRSVTLNDLLQLAEPIANVDPKERYIENGGTRSMPIRQYQMIAARFESRRATYVDRLLSDSLDQSQVVASVSRQLDDLARTSDTSRIQAIEYCRRNLLPYLQRQARMPLPLRASIKVFNKVLVIFAFVVVFGIPIYALLSHLYRLVLSH